MAHTESEILDLFEKAPIEIQEVLSSQELLDVIIGFQNTYKLHIDMVGKIAELTRNLLLGIAGPTEFYSELVLVGASPEVAKKIVDELNEKIFVPVRAKVGQKKPVAPVPEKKEALAGAPAPLLVATGPTVTVSRPTPALIQKAPEPVALPVAPITPQPAMRTMARDVETMKSSPSSSPVLSTPIPSRPVIVAPPVRSAPVAPSIEPPTPPARTPAPTHSEVADSLKQYGIDPYHEPID